MATLLHILAHPSPEHSQTLRLAQAFLDGYREGHPDATVTTLDLYHEQVPHLSATHLTAMYWQGDRDTMPPAVREAWREVIAKVEQFKAADHFLVTTPMWNFGVPSILKAYIDHVVLAGYTFQYTGPVAAVGLMTGHKMALVSTRGGIYSQPPFSHFEMCQHYLSNVFGFLGIEIAAEIVAEGLALVGPPEIEEIMEPALDKARAAARAM